MLIIARTPTKPERPHCADGINARNAPAKITSAVILMPYARVGFGSRAITVKQPLATTIAEPPASVCATNNAAIPGAKRNPSKPTASSASAMPIAYRRLTRPIQCGADNDATNPADVPDAISKPSVASSSERKSDSSPAITGSTLLGIAATLAMTMAATA